MRIALFVCLLACCGCVVHNTPVKNYPMEKVGDIKTDGGGRSLYVLTIEGHHYYCLQNGSEFTFGPEVPPRAWQTHLHRLEGVSEFITLPEQE